MFPALAPCRWMATVFINLRSAGTTTGIVTGKVTMAGVSMMTPDVRYRASSQWRQYHEIGLY
jgi:hypothetical protein